MRLLFAGVEMRARALSRQFGSLPAIGAISLAMAAIWLTAMEYGPGTAVPLDSSSKEEFHIHVSIEQIIQNKF